MGDENNTNLDREEYAIILDFLPNGYPFDNTPSYLKKPIAQAIGTRNFVLLELIPKKEAFLQPMQEVYIGMGKREEIHHVTGITAYEKLTATAKAELVYVIQNLVKKKEQQFIEFINKARSLTTRMHSLELLPGLGKKRMWELIEERENEPFKSFEDIKKRVKQMPDIVEMFTKRIIEEFSNDEQKHRLFVKIRREPSQSQQRRH
ncbi:MAG TPA: DUF655 domain-containing protein [Candidatus Woesearchaeota archaeon]|nr:DUF655 domain-containing protein [Candidatus Woesearchaeota archaeon]